VIRPSPGPHAMGRPQRPTALPARTHSPGRSWCFTITALTIPSACPFQPRRCGRSMRRSDARLLARAIGRFCRPDSSAEGPNCTECGGSCGAVTGCWSSRGLGGLGKTTLAFQTLSLITPDENDVCAFWCREAEQADDPAETLVGQLLDYCRRRFGLDWEGVEQQVDRVAGDDATQRFGYYLQTLLGNVERLAIYLDNLESLLVAPRDGQATRDETIEEEAAAMDAESFAAWRGESLRNIWQILGTLARESGKLHVVASCRYVNDDMAESTLPVSPLPIDAMFRLLNWFPALRRLASGNRARLATRLEGHPRAAEYANDLVHDRLAKHERRYGRWQLPEPPSAADVANEWTTLVEPALPRVREKLLNNLLLAEIWEQVLDERARRMLFRMTFLRRPWEWGLMSALGEPEEDAAAAEATAERLTRTSLLERVEVLRNVPGGSRQLMRYYTLHPETAEFATSRQQDDEAHREITHRRIGNWFAADATSHPFLETYIDAGHHLFAAGDYERSCEFLGRSSDWLRHRGHAREAWKKLKPFLTPAIRKTLPREKVRLILRTTGLAMADLGELTTAIEYHEEALAIAIDLKDRFGEGRDHGCLGHALLQIGNAEESAKHCRKALAILENSDDRREEANILRTLGNALFMLKEVERATEIVRTSLEMSRSLDPPDRGGEAASLTLMGNIEHSRDRFHEAIEHYQSALEIDVELGDRRGEEADRGGLGLAYLGLFKFEEATNYFHQSLQIARGIHDRQGEATALANLGDANAALNDVKKAEEYWRAALTIGLEINESRIVRIASQKLRTHGG
jgi:tetratricopeptide (TPR) repeat protein